MNADTVLAIAAACLSPLVLYALMRPILWWIDRDARRELRRLEMMSQLKGK